MHGPSHPLLWAQLSGAALSLAAGACLFVFISNRAMIYLRDGLFKVVLGWSCLLGIAGAAVGFGFWSALSAWSWAPIAVLALAGVEIVRNTVLRRRLRGAPPVECDAAPPALTRPVTTTALSVARYAVELAAWRGSAFRVAHVSDLHVDGRLPPAYYRDALARVIAARPDLLFLTGDFVNHARHAPLLPELLADAVAAARWGAFAVLGNHDLWAGGERVAECLRAARIEVLRQDARRVPVGGGGAGLWICGGEEPWGARWRMPERGPDDLVLVLMHSADPIYRLSRHDVTAVFSGHHHGGQVRLPGYGSVIVPSAYGRRFDHGHFVVRRTHLFVTAGLGAVALPLRLYCPPDLFLVDWTPPPVPPLQTS